VISQHLVSKLRPNYLCSTSLGHHADTLDVLIAQQAHVHLGFPFPSNHILLTLPPSIHACDFTSISRMNGAAAVVELQRDLNHKLILRMSGFELICTGLLFSKTWYSIYWMW
jgi:hypothetical protein